MYKRQDLISVNRKLLEKVDTRLADIEEQLEVTSLVDKQQPHHADDAELWSREKRPAARTA